MKTLDRKAFRAAARTSRVAEGARVPRLAEVREQEHLQTILHERVRPRLQTRRVDAIVAALMSDIVAARRSGGCNR